MTARKVDALGCMTYASVAMSCAPEMPGSNGSLFVIDEAIKERIEADIRAARDAVAELIDAVREYRLELLKPIGCGTHAQVVARVDAALANMVSAP